MGLSTSRFLSSLAACLAAAACGGANQVSSDSLRIVDHPGAANLIEPNGKKMNGPDLNGSLFPGYSLANQDVASVSLNSATWNGMPVLLPLLTASSFTGTAGLLHIMSGTTFTNVTFIATLTSGLPLPLHIQSATRLPAPNSNLIGYAVTYPTTSGPQSLCGYEANGSMALAVAINGTFNLGQGVAGGGSFSWSAKSFTFTCQHFAAEKCLEFGYTPWDLTLLQENLTLEAAWVACTRMLRADYCGDGTPHTVDGTMIDVFDRYGIQADAAPSWPVEAEWATGGAACMAQGVTDRYVHAGVPAPSCYQAKLSSNCGSFSKPSTLMIDRYTNQ